MKAVICHRYAGLDESGKPSGEILPLRDVLSVEEVERPMAGASQVLIEVHYAGIQYPDMLQAQGFYQQRPPLPYTPGADVAGVVAEVGSDVRQVQPGDLVIAQVPTGALAEFVAVSVDDVYAAPPEIDLSRCANVGRNYLPAYHSLKVIGQLQRDDVVLVDGASGGVGMATIQLAKAMGGHVIAGVGSDDKVEPPREAGADHVLVYGRDRESHQRFKKAVREAATELGRPDGVDVIVDMVQGELFENALVSCIRPLGKICLVGFAAGQKPIRPGIVLIKQAAVVGSLWKPWSEKHPQEQRQNVTEVLDYIQRGIVRPGVDRLFPLADFIQAFELYENNQGRGNTVVKVAG